jgi:hypothetical protein
MLRSFHGARRFAATSAETSLAGSGLLRPRSDRAPVSSRARSRSRAKPPSPPEALAPVPSGPAFSLRALIDWREPFLIPLLALLAARGFFAFFIPVAAEDAFITFRYARSFATGHGMVFNPGQHVMGFTSPLWALWMALGLAIRVEPMAWSRISAIACDVVTLMLIVSALRRAVSRPSAWCFAVFFAVWPYFSALTASGMESSAVLLLLALSAVLSGRRSRWAPLALAGLAFSRPEGLVAAVVIMIGMRRRDALIAVALIVAEYIPIALYYGSVIPQSLLAKSQVYGTPGPWAGRGWWMWLLPRPYDPSQKTVEAAHLVTLAVFFTPALIVGARRLWALRADAIARLAAAALAIWLGYSLLGVTYFYWYLLLPLVGLAVVASIGLPMLIRGGLLYASLVAYLVGVYGDAIIPYFSRADFEYEGFIGAALYLDDHARPGDTAFLEPIGMIGYECPTLKIVDEIGLVSPEVARRRVQGPGWYTDVVVAQRPDWLVTRRIMMASGEAWAGVGAPFRSPEERAALLQHYAVVDTVAPGRGMQALLILHRR